MKPEDLMLLSAFTRADAGVDYGEAKRLTPLVTAGLIQLHSRGHRSSVIVTQEGHARLAVVVRHFLDAPTEKWHEKPLKGSDNWSVNFGPNWSLNLYGDHVHYPDMWVATVEPIGAQNVMCSKTDMSRNEAFGMAKQWVQLILLRSYYDICDVSQEAV